MVSSNFLQSIVLLLASATAVLAAPALEARACTIPATKPSTTIATQFAIQVYNTSYPAIHNHILHYEAAGGGDQHLYLSPAGVAAPGLTLEAGVLTDTTLPGPLHAVINGQYTPEDNTTKMFLNERGDPRALYDVIWSCVGGTLHKVLVFKGRQGDPAGGHICVRMAAGNRYEFRYSPPGNEAVLGTGGVSGICMNVALVIKPS